MRNIYWPMMRCDLLLVLAFMVLATVSCKKEEPRTSPASTQVVSSASNESVFDEVKKKVDQTPKDADALYHLADLYDRNEQYAEAVETYKKVVALKPGMGYAYFKMGTAYDRLNQPSEAMDAFKSAAKYLPNHAMLYNNMGIAYGKLGKPDDEIAALKKATRLRPSYSSAHYNLGMTYLKKKNNPAAMQEYKALSEFDEGTAAALRKEIDKAP